MTPRRHLTPKAKAALWHEQECACADCREPLPLPWSHADHIAPLWATSDNSLSNFQLLCSRCHKLKTKREAAARGKSKRLENTRLNGRKVAVSKIQSRGFDTRLRRGFNGKVEVRT